MIKQKSVFSNKFYGCCIFLLLIIWLPAVNAQKITISGFVEDSVTGERLIMATIVSGHSGVLTNDHGFYSLQLPKGNNTIMCSFVGYKPFRLLANINNDTTVIIKLSAQALIDEIIVSQNKNPLFSASGINGYAINPSQVKKLPTILGEPDIIRAVQLLPGVQAGNEASGSLMVRGGGPGANIILLDDIPIFNVNHLWGIFSVFDASAIKSSTFFNSGFPAKYGGRLSSVLDLRLKDGNKNNYHGNVSVGLAASKVFIEGPLQKQKSSFIFSARRTYIDIPLSIVQKFKHKDYIKYRNGYYFYDIIGKLSFDLGKKNRLFFSLYTGKDKPYKIDEKNINDIDNSSLEWGNITASARWAQKLGAKVFGNFTVTHTTYYYNANREVNFIDSLDYMSFNYNYENGITDFKVKYDIAYYLNDKIKIDAGVFSTNNSFNTGKTNYVNNVINISADSVGKPFTQKQAPLQKSGEIGCYLSSDILFFNILQTSIGARVLRYTQNGMSFICADPRLLLKLLPQNMPVEFGISLTQMHQNMHLLSNCGTDMPIDLWVPATKSFKPEYANQVGFDFKYTAPKSLVFSISGYYKDMYNLVDYKDGEGFSVSNVNWGQKVTSGIGRAFGVELLAEKQDGKITGCISYTLAKSECKFSLINNGSWFNYNYDHRHEFKITANYSLKNNVGLNAVWVFASGKPITVPVALYEPYFDNFYDVYIFNQINYDEKIYDYSKRNNARMPNYHRLDINVNFTKQLKHGKRVFSAGVYNVYNRKNPYYLTVDRIGSQLQFNTNSMLPFIPYISYTYEF